jgi:hypothetical protein
VRTALSIALVLSLAACDTAAAPAAPAELSVPSAAPSVVIDDVAEDAAVEVDAETAPAGDAFFEIPDAPIVARLSTSPVAHIERGSGGRSLAFHLTLEDGTEGYFKPAQTFSGAHFYAEIASYHLDRELGFGRTPPTVGRRLAWAPLRAVASGDARVSEAIVDDDQTVCGSFSWWVPERLVALRLGHGWERWVRFDPPLAITPFQRAREYAAQAAGTIDVLGGDRDAEASAGEPDTEDRAAELSDLVLFDYLTHNIDRWGGDYTNVRTRGPGGALVFLDNAAGFISGHARFGFMDTRLHSVQRFRRSTVDAIRGFSMERYRARVEADACAPVLDDRLYAHLEERRVELLAHVDRMIAEHGEAATLAW